MKKIVDMWKRVVDIERVVVKVHENAPKMNL